MDTKATNRKANTMRTTKTLPMFPGIYCERGGTQTAGVVCFGSLASGRYAGIVASGDTFSTYRMPLRGVGPIDSVAVEIAITGKTPSVQYGVHGRQEWVRGQVVFVGDCEPDTRAKCWVRVA